MVESGVELRTCRTMRIVWALACPHALKPLLFPGILTRIPKPALRCFTFKTQRKSTLQDKRWTFKCWQRIKTDQVAKCWHWFWHSKVLVLCGRMPWYYMVLHNDIQCQSKVTLQKPRQKSFPTSSSTHFIELETSINLSNAGAEDSTMSISFSNAFTLSDSRSKASAFAGSLAGAKPGQPLQAKCFDPSAQWDLKWCSQVICYKMISTYLLNIHKKVYRKCSRDF